MEGMGNRRGHRNGCLQAACSEPAIPKPTSLNYLFRIKHVGTKKKLLYRSGNTYKHRRWQLFRVNWKGFIPNFCPLACPLACHFQLEELHRQASLVDMAKSLYLETGESLPALLPLSFSLFSFLPPAFLSIALHFSFLSPLCIHVFISVCLVPGTVTVIAYRKIRNSLS